MRLGVSEPQALGEAALARIGYGEDDARIITDQLIDNCFAATASPGGRASSP